jgi:nitrite reductase/ring-hydroxylating ferredoxin subunit
MADREREPRWRTDFPIQWERDHYVTRRELAKFITLGSATLVAANAAVAVAARARHPRVFPRVRVATSTDLAPGESSFFRYPGDDDPCILVRTRRGALVAYSQVCTHLSCAVVYRPADDRLFCPCHEGVFECGVGPAGARPIAGPPQRPLPRVLLEMQGTDVFAVGLEV